MDNEVEDFEIRGYEQNGKKKRIRAQLGRRCTHNEQVIVAPCGINIAQETFYGAEGVGSVIVSISIILIYALIYLQTGNDQVYIP